MSESPLNWIALVASLISMVGGFLLAVNQRFQARDKLQFDSKFQALEMANARCLEEHRECKEDTSRLRNIIEEHHRRSSEDRADLRSKITDVQTQIAKVNGS